MDKSRDTPYSIEAGGVRVAVVGALLAASLRYFDTAGSVAVALRETIGQAIPQPLTAFNAGSAAAPVILAWRGPTETLLLCSDRTVFAELEQRLSAAADGCLVDQTGGVCVIAVLGHRARDLLQRLGSTAAIPGVGEARTGRLAEVHVLAAQLHREEFLLVVERVYAGHLIKWITATVADFD